MVATAYLRQFARHASRTLTPANPATSDVVQTTPSFGPTRPTPSKVDKHMAQNSNHRGPSSANAAKQWSMLANLANTGPTLTDTPRAQGSLIMIVDPPGRSMARIEFGGPPAAHNKE